MLGNTRKYDDDALCVIAVYHTLLWGVWKIPELGGCAVVGAGCVWVWGLGESCLAFALFHTELNVNLLPGL